MHEMPRFFPKNLFRLKRRDAMLLGTALFVVIAVLDWATGNAISLSAFYMFPILLVAWNCGRGWGLVFAAAAVATVVLQGSPLESLRNKPIHVYLAYASVLLVYVIAVVLTAMLRKLYNQERLTARIDALTGARNRKGFQEALANEIARHERRGTTFCLAYIDCDNFKQVNDNHGHAEGDKVLKAIAEVAIDTLRRSDTVGRIGGDEFAVILPETGRTEALFVVDKLQHKLRAVTRVRQWGVSFSIGVAVFDKSPGAAIAAMEFADRLMYTAKRSSKGLTVWNSFGDPARTPTLWEVGTIGASDVAPVSEPLPRT